MVARGLSDVGAVSDEVLADWFPDGRRAVAASYELPDFAGVLGASEVSRHYMLQMAWHRYVEAPGEKRKYGYSQFCACNPQIKTDS